MLVDVVNMQGKKVSTVELPADIFEAPISVDLMHQAFVRQMANARLGTHKTKTRGGKIHTPQPRDYTKAMPRKMRRAALRSGLSSKAADLSIVMVEEMALEEPKTRLMAEALNALVQDNSALLILPEKEAYDGVIRATRNLPDAKVLLASYLNIRDLLQYDKLVMPLSALDVITENFG
jgi:large subunit ribosomal protein L4